MRWRTSAPSRAPATRVSAIKGGGYAKDGPRGQASRPTPTTCAAQTDFPDRHLARWLPGVAAARAELGDEAAPYDTLADALARFVGADCAHLDVPMAGPQPLP